jgi:hypothetical protein
VGKSKVMLPQESQPHFKPITPVAAVRDGHNLPDPPLPTATEFVEVPVPLAALPHVFREDIEDAPFWKEVAAFANMPQSHLDGHYGKYVAIYKGDIVDSDCDEGELALRFYRTFGYVPVYIHRVGVEDAVVDLYD